MTAIELFFNELKNHKLLVTPYTKGVNSLFEKAKEIEAEQIIEAYIKGYNAAASSPNKITINGKSNIRK